MVDLDQVGKRLSRFTPGSYSKIPSINPIPQPTPEGSVLGAVFRQEHLGYNIAHKALENPPITGTEDPNFNPIPFIPKDLFEYADRFAGTMSEEQVFWVADQINNELRDKAIIAGHPTRAFFSNMAIGMVDLPRYLLPGGVIYSNATQSLNLARSAANVAAASAFSTTVQEAILQETQFARDKQQSVMGVFGSALIGAVTGGISSQILPKNIADYASQEAADTMANGKPTSTVFEFTPDGDIQVRKNVPIVPTKDVKGTRITNELTQSPPAKMPPSTDIAVPPGTPPAPVSGIFDKPESGAIDYEAIKYAASIQIFDQKALQALKFNPWMRLKTSPSGLSRAMADNIFESMIGTYGTDVMQVPMPRALEVMIKTMGAQYIGLVFDYQKFFFKQRGLGEGGMIEKGSAYAKAVATGQPLPGMDIDTFNLRVYRAFRDNLIDPDPIVNEAKEFARWKIVNDLKDQAVDVGLLNKDVKVLTAANYLTRIPNRPAIVEQPEKFDAIQLEYVTQVNEQLKVTLPKVKTYTEAIARADRLLAANEKIRNQIIDLEKNLATATTNAQRQKILKKIDELKTILNSQPDELLSQAKEIFAKEIEDLKWSKIGDELAPHMLQSDGETWRSIKTQEELIADVIQTRLNYLSLGDERLTNPVLKGVVEGSTKPLMQRTNLIPDAWIEDFLIKDMSTILSYYAKSMTTAISATKWAKGMGYADVPTARSAYKLAVVDEYQELAKGKTGAERTKLDERLAQDLKDVDACLDIILGIYGNPGSDDTVWAKIADGLMVYNRIRLLGSMVPSAFPDVGSTVMRYGLYETMHNGILALLKSPELRKMSTEYLRVLGFAFNTEVGLRIKSWADTGNLSVATSKFKRYVDSIVQAHGNINLFNIQNDMLQRMAGTLAVHFHLSRIAMLMQGKQISKQDMRWIMRAGLRREDFPYYYEQWKKHGGIYEGTYFSNVQKWDITDADPVKARAMATAYERFNEAISKEVRNTIIEPTLQDKPLFVQSTFGKMATQFKGYQYAATNKVFLSAVQNLDDQRTLEGLLTMLTMGALGYTVTSLARGREPDFSFANISKEAFDRSGILGMFMEFYNMANKLGVIPGQGVTRFQTRGIWGAMFGPTIGAVEDIHKVLTMFVQANNGKPLTTKDVEALLRLMPYQNLFYAHQLTRMLANKVAVSMGAREVPITYRGNR